MNVIILGIESSCDDTSAAIFQNGKILSNCVANQEAHKQYGGIVPEVASRAHQINIIPVVDKAIKDAGIQKTDNKCDSVYERSGADRFSDCWRFVCKIICIES